MAINQIDALALDTDPIDRNALLYEKLRNRLSSYDEIWIVGHKGDLAVNLQALGILDPSRPIDLVHVNRTLGVNANIQIDPPEEAGISYEAITSIVNEDIKHHVQRIRDEGKSTMVIYPYPVKGFQQILEQEGTLENFTLTAPVPTHEAFAAIENKLVFSQIVDQVIAGEFPNNVIPNKPLIEGETLTDIRRNLNISEDRAVYFQVDMSAGGDGTQRIENQEDMNTLLTDPNWQENIRLGRIKVSSAIEGKIKADGTRERAYPANGTGCIVPTPDGGCQVYLDPLSHKPVGLPELNAKDGSGVGNDWSTTYSEAIQRQYIEIASRLGKYLYENFGYTGLFGPDCIVGIDEEGMERLYVSEINPRWQGTTPYQTMNALMNGRLPIEIMHYAAKLLSPDELQGLLEDSVEYNSHSVGETGGFYMKVGGRQQKMEVRTDMNGAWAWEPTNGLLTRLGDEISPLQVYTGSIDRNSLDLPESSKLVWIKAPKIGEIVGGGLAPVGYIIGRDLQVFNSDIPAITEEGYNLYTQVDKEIYGLT